MPVSFVRLNPAAAAFLLSLFLLPAGAGASTTVCGHVPADDPESLPCVRYLSPVLRPAESDPALRVVTYNVHYGDNVAALAEALATNPRMREADVLMLQEIESYPHDVRLSDLALKLGRHVVYAPARTKGTGTHGLAILSRYPIRDVQVVRLPHFELGWGNRRRVAMTAVIDWQGTPVWLANVHLDTRLTFVQRVRQLQPVLDLAAAHPRAVIGGDMNTISCWQALLPGVPVAFPGLSQGPDLDAHMQRHGYETPFHSIGGTGPLNQRLDAIFGRGLAVESAGIESTLSVSDHLPLWADFTEAGL
jgi:endonuclease/exonuclease/phosphatase family metal-dependent hydrolase